MPARALLVLLVMLNFGVATWWLLRPGPSAPVPWQAPEGVMRLQLLGEREDGGASGSAAAEAADGDATAPTAAPTPDAVAGPSGPASAAAPAATQGGEAVAAAARQAPVLRCLSFGPFADASTVATARGVLQAQGAARMRVRDVVDAPRGWRVAMAPQADRAAADALAARIREAGFDDLLVIPSGADANGIALGRYGSEAAARRREAGLRGAGFPAQAQPLGEAATRHWLDVAAGPGFDAAAARRAAGAGEARDADCAGIVEVGAR